MSGGSLEYGQLLFLPEDIDARRNNYSKETQKEFDNAIELINRAYIYAHRIDYLISGDDGEDTFHERLHRELPISDLQKACLDLIAEIDSLPDDTEKTRNIRLALNTQAGEKIRELTREINLKRSIPCP